MGIRFYCPACEKKINVKEHQAGLRGFCPQCGARVDIPLVSEPRRPRKPEARRESLIPNIAPGAAGEQTLSAVLPQVGRLISMSPDSPVDPLAEFPNYQWYVVPQGGAEPYGPADPVLFRQWMHEGRVGAKSMVWRQDWKDWKKAGTIWSELVLVEADAKPSPKLQRLAAAPPQFGAPAVPSFSAAGPTLAGAPGANPPPSAAPPTAETPAERRKPGTAPAGFDEHEGELYYPRRSNGLYLMMIGLLIIAVIALAFVTFRILDQMREKKPAEPSESEPSTSLRLVEPHALLEPNTPYRS